MFFVVTNRGSKDGGGDKLTIQKLERMAINIAPSRSRPLAKGSSVSRPLAKKEEGVPVKKHKVELKPLVKVKVEKVEKVVDKKPKIELRSLATQAPVIP